MYIIPKISPMASWLVMCDLAYIVSFLATGTYCYNLTILHTNDIQGQVEPCNRHFKDCSSQESLAGECFGGAARIKTKVDEFRAASKHNLLLLDAGDQYQGTRSIWFYHFGGVVMSYFMNLIGYDAMGLGNHEFDNGIEGLLPFVKNATFAVLSCNLDISEAPYLSQWIGNWTVFHRNGQRIGVIGYTTEQTAYLGRPGNLTFRPVIDSIQTAVNELKMLGINKIIALGHVGYTMDKFIAQNVTDLDIIVGGHTNTFLYSGQPPSNEVPQGPYPTVLTSPSGEPVLVVQDFHFGKYLGHLEVDFADNGILRSWSGNPILLDNSVAEDRQILHEMDPWKQQLEPFRQQVVGQSDVFLDGTLQKRLTAECNLGDVIADGMLRHNLRHSKSEVWHDVVIAIINGGDIAASIPEGNITMADIMDVLPFKHKIDIIELTGQTILDIFEFCASQWVASGVFFRGFLQVSGIRIIYDMYRPINNRVVQVQVVCSDCQVPSYRDLNTTQVYKVVMPDFLAEGGNGYDVIKNNIVKRYQTGKLDLDIFMEYLQQHSPIKTGVEGRIRFIDQSDLVGGQDSAFSNNSQSSISTFILISLFHILLNSLILIDPTMALFYLYT